MKVREEFSLFKRRTEKLHPPKKAGMEFSGVYGQNKAGSEKKKKEIMISGRATDEELDEKSGMWRWLEKNVD